jgi:hypothetical protein
MAGTDERKPEQRSPGTWAEDHMTYDVAKLDEIVLALLHLNAFSDRGVTRAWKGFDWDSLDRLHASGLIADPRSKAKSVILTDEGARLAEELFRRHFGGSRKGRA